MNFAGLNALENRTRVGARKPSRFVRGNHLNMRAAAFAPGNHSSSAGSNRGSFVRLERDDCCFFLAAHGSSGKVCLASIRFAKIRRVNVPQMNFLAFPAIE